MSFNIGDRVKLDPVRAESWLQPFRKFAYEGRLATVVNVSCGDPCRTPVPGFVRVLFDKGRATARDIRETISEQDLILHRVTPED